MTGGAGDAADGAAGGAGAMPSCAEARSRRVRCRKPRRRGCGSCSGTVLMTERRYATIGSGAGRVSSPGDDVSSGGSASDGARSSAGVSPRESSELAAAFGNAVSFSPGGPVSAGLRTIQALRKGAGKALHRGGDTLPTCELPAVRPASRAHSIVTYAVLSFYPGERAEAGSWAGGARDGAEWGCRRAIRRLGSCAVSCWKIDLLLLFAYRATTLMQAAERVPGERERHGEAPEVSYGDPTFPPFFPSDRNQA